MTQSARRQRLMDHVGWRGRELTRPVAVAGVLIGAVLFGVMGTLRTYDVLALSAAAVLGLLLVIASPRIAVALFYVSIFIPSGYVVRYFAAVPSGILWMPYLLVLVALVSRLAHRSGVRPIELPWPASYLWVGLAWTAVTALSLMANGSRALPAFLSLRGLFLVYGSILLFRLQFSVQDRERLIRILVLTGLVMLPVSIIQRVLIVSQWRLRNGGDLVTGLFTTYAELLFFQLFCILAVATWWLSGRRLLPIAPPLTIALLLVPLAISNTQAAPVYFFLVSGVLLFQYATRISRRVVMAVIVLLFLGVGGTVAVDRIYQSSYHVSYSFSQRYYTIDGAVTYLLGHDMNPRGGLQRGAAVLFNFNLIAKEPLGWILGLGPGALSDSRVPGGTGPIFARYPNLALNNNSLATVVGELGIAGVCLLGAYSLCLFFLATENIPRELIVLRRSTAVLLGLLLIYTTVLLLPVVAVVLGPLCIEPTGNPST